MIWLVIKKSKKNVYLYIENDNTTIVMVLKVKINLNFSAINNYAKTNQIYL